MHCSDARQVPDPEDGCADGVDFRFSCARGEGTYFFSGIVGIVDKMGVGP